MEEGGSRANSVFRSYVTELKQYQQGVLHKIDRYLAILRSRGVSEQRLYVNRLDLLQAMKNDLKQQTHQAAEALFRNKLASGEISLRLVSSGDAQLNWELARTLEIEVSDEDHLLRRKDGGELEKSLFEKIYQRDFNTLEKETAWYLDSSESVYWWHRIAVNQRSYSLQGVAAVQDLPPTCSPASLEPKRGSSVF